MRAGSLKIIEEVLRTGTCAKLEASAAPIKAIAVSAKDAGREGEPASPLADQITVLLRECAAEDGLSVRDLTARTNAEPGAVEALLEQMEMEGRAYRTVDEQHFRLLQS